MKGVITENLGDSRYLVKVVTTNSLLTSMIEQAGRDWDACNVRLLDLGKSVDAKQREYDAAMTAVRAASSDYQDCLTAFSPDTLTAELVTACQNKRSACYAKCAVDHPNDIGVFDCERICDIAYDDCRSRIPYQVETRQAEARAACETTHLPKVATAQKAALALLPQLQSLKLDEAREKARLLGLSQAKEQLQAIEERATIYTAFAAQYTDTLGAAAAVEVATTPDGHHTITEIVAVENYHHDARALPARVLFVDAAIETGVETWRPTWRLGTVERVNDNNTLDVTVTGGVMTGSLGSIDSRRSIDCTPAQAYFDGAVDEANITAAQAALTAAQVALTEAAAARAACVNTFDMGACMTPKLAACDVTWGAWLTECEKVETAAECLEQYQPLVDACKAQAGDECRAAQQAHQAQCELDYPLGELIQAVTDAESALHVAIANRYNPANPLSLHAVPVEHCVAKSYRVDDSVLIDFPARGASTDPMAVWKSARIIGWASNTRKCALGILVRTKRKTETGYDDVDYSISCVKEGKELAVNPPVAEFGAWYWTGVYEGLPVAVSWEANGAWIETTKPLALGHDAEACAIVHALGVKHLVYAQVTGGLVKLWARNLAPIPVPSLPPIPVGTERQFVSAPTPCEGSAILMFSASGAKLAVANLMSTSSSGGLWECAVPPIPALPEPGQQEAPPVSVSWNELFPVSPIIPPQPKATAPWYYVASVSPSINVPVRPGDPIPGTDPVQFAPAAPAGTEYVPNFPVDTWDHISAVGAAIPGDPWALRPENSNPADPYCLDVPNRVIETELCAGAYYVGETLTPIRYRFAVEWLQNNCLSDVIPGIQTYYAAWCVITNRATLTQIDNNGPIGEPYIIEQYQAYIGQHGYLGGFGELQVESAERATSTAQRVSFPGRLVTTSADILDIGPRADNTNYMYLSTVDPSVIENRDPNSQEPYINWVYVANRNYEWRGANHSCPPGATTIPTGMANDMARLIPSYRQVGGGFLTWAQVPTMLLGADIDRFQQLLASVLSTPRSKVLSVASPCRALWAQDEQGPTSPEDITQHTWLWIDDSEVSPGAIQTLWGQTSRMVPATGAGPDA